MTTNPFDVTKAVDFTDQQIAETWVDLPGGGASSLADPRSPMPRFLVGGKGGGRTHLLRHYSFALQRIRHAGDLVSGVQSDGYVGIYFRCGGLNASRFSGKGIGSQAWTATFAYYTELWLARMVVDLLADLMTVANHRDRTHEIGHFVADTCGLFDSPIRTGAQNPTDLIGLASAMRDRQRKLDLAINNSSLSRSLDIQIDASPGRLVFGVPQAAARAFDELSSVTFAYLIDEFENLDEDQQKYVNTLVREKEIPSSFLIGSRRFGLRTQKTLAAGEENRVGSEYDLVILEDEYSQQFHRYQGFCVEMVTQRLERLVPGWIAGRGPEDLFELPGGRRGLSLEERAQEQVSSARRSGARPWISKIEQQVSEHRISTSPIAVARALAVPESPLHEKFAVFLFYREWASGADDMLEAAERSAASARLVLSGSGMDPELSEVYDHYKADLYAQLRQDLKLSQEYVGFSDFVRMSGYLPRNLLVVLKQITRWALFQGEDPFAGSGRISTKSQDRGVREAANWFLSDAKGLGQVGEETQLAMRRLGSLFREARLSDKPVEVACSTFSTDRRGLTSRALICLDEALSHSLLLEVQQGRRDKNSHSLDYKYQLNPMLAPLFDLSLARRGSMSLSALELNSIFDVDLDVEYERFRRRVLARMNAPFGRTGAPQATLDLGLD